jgi:hypothetical protein
VHRSDEVAHDYNGNDHSQNMVEDDFNLLGELQALWVVQGIVKMLILLKGKVAGESETLQQWYLKEIMDHLKMQMIIL